MKPKYVSGKMRNGGWGRSVVSDFGSFISVSVFDSGFILCVF